MPPCDSRVGGSRHARGADQPRRGGGHAPAVLLGGSPLDMATPPSPLSPCRGNAANDSSGASYRAARAHYRPCHRVAAGRRGGYRAAMDLAYPREAEEFRVEIAGWLKENLPDGWGDPGFSMTPQERKAFNEEWTATLYAGGWICA